MLAARPGETEDLATLSTLDEAILLEELKVRYSKDKIYTCIGDILVALNPFKSLQIYSLEHRKHYRNVRLSQSPPHIFATADAAYQQMQKTGKHQCVIISGESGAGKTESAKLIVSQLMELSRNRSIPGLEQKILQVDSLLEAFGNAKTLMNNNSSRFGKYLQLKFKDGCVTGAKISEYLLEKSRVVAQGPQERNFHVFYYMLVGLSSDRKRELKLSDSKPFKYLENGGASVFLEDDREQLAEVCNALDLVGFEASFQEHIFRCLAAVLHLGNIEFHEDANEYSYILEPRSGPVQTVSELLGIEAPHLMDLLTVSVSYARGEPIRKHLSKKGSEDARDAVAKAIYDRIFRWIVNRINQLLAPTAAEMTGEREIGILDIFGFEHFERNSFEQICINVANEQLQFFFIEHIFLLEKEEYRKEGVDSLDIFFHNNKPVLELFLSKPLGFFALLDEQCNFPRSTDRQLVTKLNQALKKKKGLYIPSKDTASTFFSIQHYAGKVTYDSTGFLDKNKDTMPGRAIALLRTSTNDLINLLFTANITKTGTLALGRLTLQRLKKKDRGSKRGERSVTMVTSKPPTLGTQFKNSLHVLIEKMRGAVPHFIRCIRPNTTKSPGKFDTEVVVTQLRYTGMLETTRIRREGYPLRPLFTEFVEKYGILAPPGKNSAESCLKILQRVGLNGFKKGKSKLFLKYSHSEKLDDEMSKVNTAAVIIQKNIRGFIQRSNFQTLLALKQEQERSVAEFFAGITSKGEEVWIRQLALCELDKDHPFPSAPSLELLESLSPPSSLPSPSAPPISLLPQNTRWHSLIKSLPSPPDFSMPPPEPYFAHFDNAAEEDGVEINLEGEELFVSPGRNTNLKKYGREGTKSASMRWFEETQAPYLRSSTGHFPDWFQGLLTRHQAEKLLTDSPRGTFLIRICGNRFGFSLSLRSQDSFVHRVISQLETGKYVMVGEPKVHTSLSALVFFYSKFPVSLNGDVLTQSCKAEAMKSSNIDVLEAEVEARREGKRKTKLSRTRSHDPQLGYGALKPYITKKSTNN